LRARKDSEQLAARLPGKLNAEQLAEGIIEIWLGRPKTIGR
jgi:hypothetical protein